MSYSECCDSNKNSDVESHKKFSKIQIKDMIAILPINIGGFYLKDLEEIYSQDEL